MRHLSFVCIFALFPLLAAPAQTPAEKKATIEYLRGLQTGDGGFLPAQPNPNSGARVPPTLRATTGALRALKYFGGEPRDRKGAVKYVEGAFQKSSGGFVDVQPGLKPDAISTAVGILAVVDLKIPTKTYAEPAMKFLVEHAKTFEEVRMAAAAVEALGIKSPTETWPLLVAQMRNPDGTYGKGAGQARATGSAVVTVLRLGGKVDQRDNVLKALKAGQRPDGGFGKEESKESDLETSYRVMRCFHMMKEKPDADKLRAFIAKCRNADGGYGVAPGQKSSGGGTYFAAIILHWLQEK